MTEASTFPAARLDHEGATYRLVDLPALAGERLRRLPVVLRLLLENAVRNLGSTERDDAVRAVFDWLKTGTSEAEIAVQPGRVLMHDTTSTPALVDVAAMRDALAEQGVDPAVLHPTLPVDVSVDHSLAVEAYARPDAAALNLAHELRRNDERYRFLRWASKALRGVRIHPPGTGIMHTINLEQLATVVTVEERDGERWLVPDVMIGTDSHTPMVNGIGVLGWGVGGLEAQTVMFGMPTVLRVPDVIGVALTGCLAPGVVATDLALVVTQRLRAIGVSGEFVEFFGPGVATLSAGDRAVVANMAPEYGATTGYFPVDAQTLAYLRRTGRTESHVCLVEAYARRTELWFEPDAAPRYTRTIAIDLGTLGMQVAGPRRPQDAMPYWQTGQALAAAGAARNAVAGPLPACAVALAAITSCTNTSDPRLLITAGLLARNARAAGLKVPPWVKTSLAPGSPAAATYLARAGLAEDLAAVGFGIVGYGCTTCIGNAGPPPEVVRDAVAANTTRAVAVLSGNRNFPGRIHPDLDLAFIMAPPLVVAFALAGDAARNLRDEPVQLAPDGSPVWLRDPARQSRGRFPGRAWRGSQRPHRVDWAAKGPRLLGVRAVLAASFERIHRSNLIGMGILPLRLPAGMHPHTAQLRPGDQIEIDAAAEKIAPRGAVPVRILRADGSVQAFEAKAAVETRLEVDLLRVGGVIASILRRTLAAAVTAP